MSCDRTDLSEKLILFIDGKLSREEHGEMAKHISQCSQCREELEKLTSAVALIQVSADHIRQRWVHPTSGELLDLSESLRADGASAHSPEKREMMAHISLCSDCREELALLVEVDKVEEPELSEESVEMPANLMIAFENLYAKTGTSAVSGAVEEKRGFWSHFRGLFTSFKFAYGAVVIAIIATVAVLFNPSTHTFRNVRVIKAPGNGGDRYIEFPISGISTDEKQNFTQYLKKRGFPAEYDNKKGRIMVKSSWYKDAHNFLTSYREDNLLADSDNYDNRPPMDFLPVLKGDGKLPGQQTASMPPDTRRILRIQSAFLQREPEADQIRDSLRMASLDGPDDSMDSGYPAGEDDVFPITFDDLEARDAMTRQIQDDIRSKIQDILSGGVITRDFGVQVFVTLSPRRDFQNNYQLRSVTVYIEHPRPVTSQEQSAIVERIRHKMQWKGIWDERFIFDQK